MLRLTPSESDFGVELVVEPDLFWFNVCSTSNDLCLLKYKLEQQQQMITKVTIPPIAEKMTMSMSN